MNCKVFRAISFALALSAFAFGFTACGNGKNNTHTHEFTYCEAEDTAYSEEGYGYRPYRCCLSKDCGYTDYILTGFNGESVTRLIIPSSCNGKPVSAIDKNAFNSCDGITEVVIPDSIENIGESAFYNCGNLKSVSVGGGVTEIGELAFADCYSLENVTLGNGVKTVGDYAFSQCYELKYINFPSSVETIGECAFVSCQSLDSATLQDGLKSIGDCAFGGCTSLKSFVMPDSVTSIGWGVLMFDVGAVGFEPADDTTNNLTRVVISNSITEIPDYAFSKSNIRTVEIGEKVTKICYSSFFGCGQLESVVIPKSVERIQSFSFYRCTMLDTVYYAGSAEEWDKITIAKNGNDILSATKYFYSETKPDTEGNYWHYIDGNPVKW